MKILIRIAVFLAVFVLVLIWRFPYDALVESSIRKAESATNATITYKPVSAGPLGVKVSDLQINMPSGAAIRFDSAKLFPTTSGARVTALQEHHRRRGGHELRRSRCGWVVGNDLELLEVSQFTRIKAG